MTTRYTHILKSDPSRLIREARFSSAEIYARRGFYAPEAHRVVRADTHPYMKHRNIGQSIITTGVISGTIHGRQLHTMPCGTRGVLFTLRIHRPYGKALSMQVHAAGASMAAITRLRAGSHACIAYTQRNDEGIYPMTHIASEAEATQDMSGTWRIKPTAEGLDGKYRKAQQAGMRLSCVSIMPHRSLYRFYSPEIGGIYCARGLVERIPT